MRTGVAKLVTVVSVTQCLRSWLVSTADDAGVVRVNVIVPSAKRVGMANWGLGVGEVKMAPFRPTATKRPAPYAAPVRGIDVEVARWKVRALVETSMNWSPTATKRPL